MISTTVSYDTAGDCYTKRSMADATELPSAGRVVTGTGESSGKVGEAPSRL